MSMRNLADRAATAFINGVNSGNPEHQRMESLGLPTPREHDEAYRRDRRLLMALGGVGVATVAAEVVVIELAGTDAGLPALAVGAGVLVASGVIVDRIQQRGQ